MPAGATIRHAKTLFLDCLIPFPNQPDAADVVAYVETLTRAVMAKEKAIRSRHQQILADIALELANNQKPGSFVYDDPTIDDVLRVGRMDANLFTPVFKRKEFFIQNYLRGFSTVENLGFASSRGQNLQLTAIGYSIYTDTQIPGYYTLMLPKHLSRYGTVEDIEYLGSPKQLKTLTQGDIIFGAEGFDKGRSIVILETDSRTITNIHGITLHHRDENLTLSIFIKCFLDYLRNEELIDLYAVGGNGGSLGLNYWSVIPFPLFPEAVQAAIAALYHTPDVGYDTPAALTLVTFAEADTTFTAAAGIVELDRAAKRLRARLDEVLDAIARDVEVEISFDFLTR